jgi:hypothetical protein
MSSLFLRAEGFGALARPTGQNPEMIFSRTQVRETKNPRQNYGYLLS